MQGPYPVGNATAQPELRFALPVQEAGAKDQTFRLIVKPELWGRQVRLRFSNAYGTKAVTFDNAFVGLQMSGAALMPGSQPARSPSAARRRSPIPPGGQAWSDAVTLPWVANPARARADGPQARRQLPCGGRDRAADLAREGAADQLHHRARAPARWASWRTKARSRTARRAGSSSMRWTCRPPPDTRLVVCFGDSITDGTAPP